MKNNKLFITGMAVALTFGLALAGCSQPETETEQQKILQSEGWEYNWGAWEQDTNPTGSGVTEFTKGTGHRNGYKDWVKKYDICADEKSLHTLINDYNKALAEGSQYVVDDIPWGKYMDANGDYQELVQTLPQYMKLDIQIVVILLYTVEAVSTKSKLGML
jgi:hypothetical protein